MRGHLHCKGQYRLLSHLCCLHNSLIHSTLEQATCEIYLLSIQHQTTVLINSLDNYSKYSTTSVRVHLLLRFRVINANRSSPSALVLVVYHLVALMQSQVSKLQSVGDVNTICLSGCLYIYINSSIVLRSDNL